MNPQDYLLLRTFQQMFERQKYRHRDASLGDKVASCLYDDLVAMGTSAKLVERNQSATRVVNSQNLVIGKKRRRGDGTFGELVPGAVALAVAGFNVKRGPIATMEI